MCGTHSEGEKAREVEDRLITQELGQGGPRGPCGLGLQAALGAGSCSKRNGKLPKPLAVGGLQETEKREQRVAFSRFFDHKQQQQSLASFRKANLLEADVVASKERLNNGVLRMTGTKKMPQIPEVGL